MSSEYEVLLAALKNVAIALTELKEDVKHLTEIMSAQIGEVAGIDDQTMIKALRERKGLLNKDIGDLIGCSESAISRIMTGSCKELKRGARAKLYQLYLKL